MPTKDDKETKAQATPQAEAPKAESAAKKPDDTFDTTSLPPEGKETLNALAQDLAGTLTPEPPERVDRPTDEQGAPLAAEGTTTVDLGFPVGPVTLVPAGLLDDRANAAQHVGWIRPVAAAEPMPDVSGWKAWEWCATGSARDNFDRVLIRPGQVFDTERDVYDAETCEKEYTFAGGTVADGYYIPTNYVDRRRRALTLRVFDVTVPESAAFRLPAAVK